MLSAVGCLRAGNKGGQQFARYLSSEYRQLKKLVGQADGILEADLTANQTIHHDSRTPIGEMLGDIVGQYSIGEQQQMRYCFGYGSKVFSQGAGVDISNSQIDMIYVVDDSTKWHGGNVASNGGDYSFLKYLGPRAIDFVGQLGAGVYFNPFVQLNLHSTPMELKYGVASMAVLCDDLVNWRTMYLAGRLHKPVAVVQNDNRVALLQQYNLVNAVRLAVALLARDEITEVELYMAIAGLSYMGDPRLKVQGENPDKVKNIVENQYSQFHLLYRPIINTYLKDLLQVIRVDGEMVTVKVNADIAAASVLELPALFQDRIVASVSSKYAGLSKEQTVRAMDVALASRAIRAAVESTVASAAITQSLKGVLTAGLVRSWRYAMAKRAKAIRKR